MNKQIGELLKQNARNVANFGTGGKYDLKTIENFDKAWQDIEQKIKEIDANFYEVIRKQDD